jgi:integrase
LGVVQARKAAGTLQVAGGGEFGNVGVGRSTATVGKTPAQQVVSLTNNGDGPLTFGRIELKGDSSFTMSRQCVDHLDPKATCFQIRKCTSRAYECWLDNYIIPKWGRTSIVQIEACEVQEWLESLEISGKSRAEIRGVMKRLLKVSMFRKFQKQGPNPIDLVELKGTKRKSTPRLLTIEEFIALVNQLAEPFRTMVRLALFHGLGASEVLALKWKDVDWLDSSIKVERSIVCQVEDDTKTPNRQARLPLVEDELEILRQWRARSEFTEADNYIFASPHSAGMLPYHYTIYLWKLNRACKPAGIPNVTTHTFRHTYRSIAGSEGIPLATIKDMMRHADIRTTMNVYGGTVSDELRKAHSKVVRIASR